MSPPSTYLQSFEAPRSLGSWRQAGAEFLRRSLIPAVRRQPELLLFALLIGLANAPLVTGRGWASLAFQPGAVRQGQWWRLATHPFVHVTWYHLLLDGSAFFILYHSLAEERLSRRLSYVLAGAGGSLAVAWSSASSASGLCGLSGIAHGLMAVSALEMVAEQPARSPGWRIGLATFGLVGAKAAYEALTGRVFFHFLDFGLLGSPVSVSHAGGIVGALALMLWLRSGPRKQGKSGVVSRATSTASSASAVSAGPRARPQNLLRLAMSPDELPVHPPMNPKRITRWRFTHPDHDTD